MDDCPFYKTGRMTRSQTIRAGMVPIPVNRPWCEHKNSPVTEKRARRWPESSLLRCAGLFDKCPINYKPE